ncbi:MAG: hypothetical protein Q9184_005948 [Pyrenodesmia sp. 2 TL-2023]
MSAQNSKGIQTLLDLTHRDTQSEREAQKIVQQARECTLPPPLSPPSRRFVLTSPSKTAPSA